MAKHVKSTYMAGQLEVVIARRTLQSSYVVRYGDPFSQVWSMFSCLRPYQVDVQ